MTDIERKRQQLQIALDSKKNLRERNKLGQFSTPYPLACQICVYLKTLIGGTIDSFLEPSIGTGVFYSSLSEIVNIRRAVGYEVDSYYYNPTKELWHNYGIKLINQDFLEAYPNEKFSLIIANPPYSRHHHIPVEIKAKLSKRLKELYEVNISGLAGLHIYFVILSTQWLKDDGYSCWLIPSEFLSVNYGIEFKRFLLNHVDLISIHSYDNSDVQFNDALVSSTILVFRKSKNRTNYVNFSWGADINKPSHSIKINKSELNPNEKWNKEFLLKRVGGNISTTTLGSYFKIKRGIATGDNSFFIINEDTRVKYNIPKTVLTPLIPPPRKLKTNIYTVDDLSSDGLYLITCREPLDVVKDKYEGLYNYIKEGMNDGVNLRANCRNRTPWYGLERRDVPPILVSYMGRDNNDLSLPIKFILNQANVIATNSYLCLYIKDEYKHNNDKIYKTIWHILSSIPKDVLIAHGRMYGGGLLKWEPKELESIPCPDLSKYLNSIQPSLFEMV